MALNSRTANIGISSFMQGFSFVDDIQNRKKAQAKLDARLEEERTDRQFRRDRLETIDAQRLEDRGIAAEDRERIENERVLGQEGDRLALDPKASQDDLLRTAPFSANAFAKLAKTMGRAEALKALKAVQSSGPQTQTGGLNAAVTGGEPGAIDTTSLSLEDSLLRPSRGRSAGVSVDLDEISDFDSAAPSGSFGARLAGDTSENFEGAGDRITGAFRGLSTGAANLVSGASNALFGTELPPAASGANFGDAVGGNITVPDAFTTEAEFATLSDPAEFEAARQTNRQIVDGIKERGVNASNETTLSRLDALKAGSRADRAEAQRQEFLVTEKYQGFGDATSANKMRELAASDPQAGAVEYSNDRATLASANPGLGAQMDMAFQPVFLAAEIESINNIRANSQGSSQRAKATSDLRALRVTQTQMYEDYSPSLQAGINDQGMPIGNAALSNQMMQAVNDPNRPLPAEPFSARQVMTAGTITNRMSNTRRATDLQLKNALILKDAGLASDQDIMTLNMTGSWPPTSPAATLKAFKPGDVVVAQGADGSYKIAFTVPDKGSRGGKNGLGDIGSNQLTPDGIKQFRVGTEILYPAGKKGTDEMQNTLVNWVLQSTDELQETLDLTDPLAMQLLGQTYAGVLALVDAEDSGWIPNPIERAIGGLPTAAELFASPSMAAALAVEHNIPLALDLQKLLPRHEDVQINNLRQELQIPGKFHPKLEEAANTQDDETFIMSIGRYDAIVKQNSGQ